MREGPQLNMEKRETLVTPVTEHEIFKALSHIRGLKAPGIYGFGAKLFKANWLTINDNVVAVILDFFENEKFFKAFNNTLVTLIPKSDEARTIKDYSPIVVYTIFYKIISKIITNRLSRVLSSIIRKSQDAFVPGPQIIIIFFCPMNWLRL